jgi:DNA-binding MarR family transcriptional regulator
MAGKLQAELKQTRPFRTVEEEAVLNIQRTADLLHNLVNEVLKPFGLSPTQYNVLRILRGAGSAGLICKEIGERMVTPDPDITRLLDRLEKRSLVQRSRDCKTDRRQVTIRIAPDGLEILRKLDSPTENLSRTALKSIEKARLKQLIDTLEEIRSAVG